MRLREFTSDYDELIEDDADSRGDADLIATLLWIQNRSHDTHLVPKIRVDSLINMVKTIPGNEAFNYEAFIEARDTNDTIKDLIKDVKEDENGIKYVFISPRAEDSDDIQSLDSQQPATPPEKTVGAMAKSALAKRS